MENKNFLTEIRGQEADRNELSTEQAGALESEFIQADRVRSGRFPLKRWLAMISVVGLFAAAYYVYSRIEPEAKAPIFVDVQRGEFTVKLTEMGDLRALDSVTVSAIKDDPVIFLVPQGSEVKKGDVLVRFDATKYEVALEDSEAAFKVAQADQQKAQMELEAQKQKLLAEIARFRAEVTVAELALEELKARPSKEELERAQLVFEQTQMVFNNAENKRKILPDLLEKGFITRSTLEEAELKYFEAKANRQTALYNLRKVKAGATPKELEQAKIRIQQTKFALEKAQHSMISQLRSYEASVDREKANVGRAKKLIKKAKHKLSRMKLRAPRDGIVVYANSGEGSQGKVQLGMIPYEGQPLLYLPSLSSMVIDLEIDEFDIGKVKLGGPVELRLEAYPDTMFRGSVHKIGSLARHKRNPSGASLAVKVFDVTIMVQGKDPRLKPGLTATVEIIADRQQNVIFVPLSAVESRHGQPTVFVSDAAGKIEKRAIVLGSSNEHSVIVKEGLHVSEKVVIGHSTEASF